MANAEMVCMANPLQEALTPAELRVLLLVYTTVPVEYIPFAPAGVLIPHMNREGWLIARDQASHIAVLRGAR